MNLSLRSRNCVGIAFLAALLAVGPAASAQDDKGRVGSLGGLVQKANVVEMLALGTSWDITECCGWTGTWVRRPNTNIFDATWKHTNGTVVRDVITLTFWNKATGEVSLSRQGNNGTYRGFLDGSGHITRGTASWYPTGATWSASLYANDQDQKGRVTIRVPR